MLDVVYPWGKPVRAQTAQRIRAEVALEPWQIAAYFGLRDREDTWFGGRLGVSRAYRRVGAVGTALITEAVSTAHAWGCRRFLATVQEANARYFEHHHFRRLEALELLGRPHFLMEADLGRYPEQMSSGFRARAS
jgi:putative N-acetyltransferase (TIGR04045 family)